jgi:hypothetical protein
MVVKGWVIGAALLLWLPVLLSLECGGGFWGGNAPEVSLRNVVGERGSLDYRLLGYTGHLSMGGRLLFSQVFQKVSPISALRAVLFLVDAHLVSYLQAL